MTYSAEYRRMLNKIGYYNYQNGLIYRHLNQEGGWDEHLKHCRSFILQAIDFYKPEKVSILGSGWLLDVPLIELVEKAKKICLVDVVHPPEVIRQVKGFKSVELLEHDITGGLIEEVWQKAGKYSFLKKLKTLDNINIPEYKPADHPGMVISLNIITQLESLLIDFLRNHSRIREEAFYRFKCEIQKKHIDFLKKHSSVLICDTAEIIRKKSGSITTIPTFLTDLPASKFSEEWTWDFDQRGSDFHNAKSVMRVIALII